MGDAYLRGDWEMAVNGVWSPLYSWLLGLSMLLFRPSPYWEVAVAHLVNFVIYLCALVCFELMLRELVRGVPEGAADSQEGRAPLPEWAWLALGYTLFLWTTLDLVTIAAVTPDMCIAAFVFLATATLLRLRRGETEWPTFVLWGVALGLSYLAKAAMLPVVLVFLLTGLFCAGRLREALPRVLLTLAVFLLVGSVYFLPLSLKKGRATLGDSGLLNYAWYVNQVALHVHWQGQYSVNGRPEHPTRRVRDAPAVYEFRQPIKGTYPPWYDPSYWYEGVTVHLDLKALHRAFVKNLGILRLILWTREQRIWWAGFLLLYLLGCSRPRHLFKVLQHWYLLLPAVTALLLFSLVHVEARYTAAFIVLLWVGLFSGVRLSAQKRLRQAAACVVIGLSLVMLRGIAPPARAAAHATYLDIREGEGASPHVHWEVAHNLKLMGLQPGDEVASIGYAFDALWARLARVRIVSEITEGSRESPARDVEMFWAADASTQAAIFETFKRAGAKAVIASGAPADAAERGWRRIGNTVYHAYVLDGRVNPPAAKSGGGDP